MMSETVSADTWTQASAVLRWIDECYWDARKHFEAMPKSVQKRIHGKRYCLGYELDIDVYTRHWLAANSDKLAPGMLDFVREHFGYKPESSRFLEKGQTIYALPKT